MHRSPHSQQTALGLPFRALYFLLLLLLLFLFLVGRVIPCILCDLFDLCKPNPGRSSPAAPRSPLHTPSSR